MVGLLGINIEKEITDINDLNSANNNELTFFHSKKYKDIAVIFAGGDVSKFKIDFHHLNAGALSINELPDLYSQCDLALVLSGTNLSLLPMEIAACQCPLVSVSYTHLTLPTR